MKTPGKRYDQSTARVPVQTSDFERYQGGKTARSDSKEFGIRVEFVFCKRRELDQYQEASFSGNGNPRTTEEQTEVARLKKELDGRKSAGFGDIKKAPQF
mgnify:CR=1 FL=1